MKKTLYAALFAVSLVAASLAAIQDPMRPSDGPMAALTEP